MTQAQGQPAEGGVESRLSVHGKMSYFDIPAVDVRASATFYEAAFGWHVEVRDERSGRFDAPGEVIGHWVTDRAPSSEPGVVPYVYVDGIEAAIQRITANGGEVLRGPYPEGNLLVADFKDPAGNVLGIWEQAER